MARHPYRPSVSLSVPPGLAVLDCWGLDVGDEWWALAIWTVRVSPPSEEDHPHEIRCAAWVPGHTVTQPQAAIAYLHVKRIRLPAEPAEWPGPVSRPGAVWQPEENSYYLGALLGGEEPRLPPEAGIPWGERQGGAYG